MGKGGENDGKWWEKQWKNEGIWHKTMGKNGKGVEKMRDYDIKQWKKMGKQWKIWVERLENWYARKNGGKNRERVKWCQVKLRLRCGTRYRVMEKQWKNCSFDMRKMTHMWCAEVQFLPKFCKQCNLHAICLKCGINNEQMREYDVKQWEKNGKAMANLSRTLGKLITTVETMRRG